MKRNIRITVFVLFITGVILMSTLTGSDEYRIKLQQNLDCTICELVDTRGLTRFLPCDTSIWYYLSMDRTTNDKIVEFVNYGATRVTKAKGDSIIHLKHIFISDKSNLQIHTMDIGFHVGTDNTLTESVWIRNQ